MEKTRNEYKMLVEKLVGSDVGVRGRIKLKWILKEWIMIWTEMD
jgi:hypothetical protein